MALPLVVVGCTSKQSVTSQCEATIASGVDNAASPRLADTAERDYFTLREADHYAKTTGRKLRSILGRAVQIELPISMATHAIIVSNTHTLPAE